MTSRLIGQTIVTPAWEEAVDAFERELGWERVAGFPTDPAWLTHHGFEVGRHGWTAIVRPPESGDAFLRLVEGDTPPAPQPARRAGLCQATIRVASAAAAYEALRASAVFAPLSPPDVADLRGHGGALTHSFAVVGPGGAGLGFEETVHVAPPGRRPESRRLFDSLVEFGIATNEPAAAVFPEVLGLDAAKRANAPAPVVAQLFSLQEETEVESVRYGGEGGVALVMDVHSAGLERPRPMPGRMPSGNAILTIDAGHAGAVVLDRLRGPRALRAEPREIRSAPYAGRPVAIAQGPSGELIEIVC